YSSQSMGRCDTNHTLARCHAVVSGSVLWRCSLLSTYSSQYRLPAGDRRTSYELLGMLVLNAASIFLARTGLSTIKPSSVFSVADRGSKLYEPTKKCVPSTEKVLACRLEPELPKRPGRESGRGALDSERFISNSLIPAVSRSLRHLA